MKTYISLKKQIEGLQEGEYFYTKQPAKSVHTILSRNKNLTGITTKKCFVHDQITGQVLDILWKVTKI